MALNLKNQIALGFLCIISLIFAPVFLSSSPINISLDYSLNLSIIADLLVAFGTIILAFFTYKSVNATEKQGEILNQTFLLSQKVFSKDQIIDQIKTFLDPLSLEIKKEIPLVQKMDICDNSFQFVGLLQSRMEIQCVDLGSIKSFINDSDDSPLKPHLIYLKENNPELLELLKKRSLLISSCKLRFRLMIREIHKYDENIENIILMGFDVYASEEETGWGNTISVDYVILHTNPEDGSINDLSVPLQEIQRTMYSLFLSDTLNPINNKKFPIAFDIDYEYNLVKKEG